MDQGFSSDANSHLAHQEIPHLLWNLKVHYRVHKITQLVPILSHMYPVYNSPPYFSKIHIIIIIIIIIIIFPSMTRPSEWPLSCRFSDQNSV